MTQLDRALHFVYALTPHKQHFYSTFKLISLYNSFLTIVFSIMCAKYFKIGQKA